MGESLQRWDRAVEQFQADASRLVPGAESELAVATVLLDRHRIEDALRALKAAESQDDSRADIYTLQALAYGASDRPSEAARALRRASALAPDNPARSTRWRSILRSSGQPEDAARARRDFQRALRKRDGRVERVADRVDALRAGRSAETGGGVAPIFPQARYVEGYAALRTGGLCGCGQPLRRRLANDPLVAGDAAARARVVRAASMIREGRLATALEQLQRVAADSPDHAEAHRLLGLTYWLDDQHGKSIEHAAHGHSSRAGRRTRDESCWPTSSPEDRRFAEAERELTQAIESGLRSGLSRYRLAQSVRAAVAAAARRPAAFTRAKPSAPSSGATSSIGALGSLLVNQADFDGAVAAYARRIEVNPNNGEAHRQLGEIYFLQGTRRGGAGGVHGGDVARSA